MVSKISTLTKPQNTGITLMLVLLKQKSQKKLQLLQKETAKIKPNVSLCANMNQL